VKSILIRSLFISSISLERFCFTQVVDGTQGDLLQLNDDQDQKESSYIISCATVFINFITKDKNKGKTLVLLDKFLTSKKQQFLITSLYLLFFRDRIPKSC